MDKLKSLKGRLSITNEFVFKIVKILISTLIALGITFVVLALVSDHPLENFIIILTSPVKKLRYFGNTIEMMIPVAFAGLSAALLFKMGVFNLFVEGLYYICGVACAAAAVQQIGNGFVHPLLCILISCLLGSFLMGITGFLKARYNTNEVVSTLMLNNIMLGVGLFFLKRTGIRDEGFAAVASKVFSDSAKLDILFPGTRFTVSFLLLILTVVFVYVLIYKTRLGYSIRITGINSRFAHYSGISVFAMYMMVHAIAGAIAGLGTSTELLSLYDRFQWTDLPGLGWDGILMATLADNHPVGILIASFGIAYLKKGAEVVSLTTNVPVEIISIVQAILVLLVSSQRFLVRFRERKLLKEGMKDELG